MIIKLLMVTALVFSLAQPVSAMEFLAPEVPQEAEDWMPEDTGSIGSGLSEMLKKGITQLQPEMKEGLAVCRGLLVVVLVLSILHCLTPDVPVINLAGTAAIGVLLMGNASSMIGLGARTIQDMSEYGKLLFPVMTAAMAAQGGVTASAALYVGTSVLNTVFCSLIARFLLPMVNLYLALTIADRALGEAALKRMADMIKSAMSWCLKTALMVFTTYMSITGVVSGTTDAAALKAAKVMISSTVPVVGGILSDASESILVSVALMKNAAGVYGIFAILALFLAPFLKIGIQYLLLKICVALCAVFGSKNITGLVEDITSAMGMVLAMTGSVCLLLLISTICFMKGLG